MPCEQWPTKQVPVYILLAFLHLWHYESPFRGFVLLLHKPAGISRKFTWLYSHHMLFVSAPVLPFRYSPHITSPICIFTLAQNARQRPFLLLYPLVIFFHFFTSFLFFYLAQLNTNLKEGLVFAMRSIGSHLQVQESTQLTSGSSTPILAVKKKKQMMKSIYSQPLHIFAFSASNRNEVREFTKQPCKYTFYF